MTQTRQVSCCCVLVRVFRRAESHEERIQQTTCYGIPLSLIVPRVDGLHVLVQFNNQGLTSRYFRDLSSYFPPVSLAHRICRIISQYRNRERRSTSMEAKSDERFYTPRSSARRGYSSAGSEDERFVSPRTSARSVSSDDNEYTTPREHASSPTQSEDYLKRAAGKVPRLGASEVKQPLPEYDEKPTKCAEAATSRAYSARPSSAASEIRNVQYVEAPAVPENDVFSAARHNRIDSVTYMLDQGISVNTKDVHGNTILSIACQNGLKRMAKLALRRGANINSQNNRGNTALHFCFAYGYGDSLGEYLISKGADTRIENDDGLVCYEGIDPRSPRK